jgi:hypothetical protein
MTNKLAREAANEWRYAIDAWLAQIQPRYVAPAPSTWKACQQRALELAIKAEADARFVAGQEKTI